MTFAVLLGLVLAILPVVAICFAGILGGRAERVGAGLYAVCVLLTWGAQALGDIAPYGTFMAIDLLTAIGFGVLTFRNPEKLWPGVAGCGQLLVFVFSATRALEFPLSEMAYLYALNISGLSVLAALVLGTVAARWRPHRPSEWDIAAEKLNSLATRAN